MKIALLGVGNILLKDEGIGVRVVQGLMSDYSFPPHVQLIDGGTLGPHLLNHIKGFAEIIVIDAVQGGEKPGTLYKFLLDQIPFEVTAKLSTHQIGILEVLSQVKLLGEQPRVTFIGIEPEDISPWGMELSPRIKEKIPALIDMTLNELEQLGVKIPSIVPEGRMEKSSGMMVNGQRGASNC